MITSLYDVPLPHDCVIVFDLDDTLYLERDFVRSGLREAARVLERAGSERAFQRMLDLFDSRHTDPIGAIIEQDSLEVDKRDVVRLIREHKPDLKLAEPIARLLTEYVAARRPLGIITDGRSLTQRNKIRSLGLETWIREIIISEEFGSEKPAIENYSYFERKFPGRNYAYVGDNLCKDFVAPNRLGWTTIALRDGGRNVHPQHADEVEPSSLPHFMIERIA